MDKHYGFENIEHYGQSYHAYSLNRNLYDDAERVLKDSADFYLLPDGSIIAIVSSYYHEGTERSFFMVRSENETERAAREKYEAKVREKEEQNKLREKAQRKEARMKRIADEAKVIERLRKKGYIVEQKSDTTKPRTGRSKAVNLSSEDGSSNC